MAGLTDALSFRVGLDVTEVKSGLATVTKEAKKTGTAMDTALDNKGAAALKKLPTAAKAAGAAMGDATEKASAFAQVNRNLAFQVFDVIQSVQAGMPAMRALAVQGSDVAFQYAGAAVASGKFAGAASMIGPALGVVGVALGAAATATVVFMNATADSREELTKYQNTLEDVNATTRSVATSTAALKLATGDVAGFVGDLQIQTALLNGDIERADIVAGELGGTLADQLAPSLLSAGRAFAENEVRITNLQTALSSGRLSVSETTAAMQQLQEARAASPALLGDLNEIKALATTGRVAVNAYADALSNASSESTDLSRTTRILTEDMRAQQAMAREGRNQILSAASATATLAGIRRESAAALLSDTAQAEFAIQQQLEATIATIDALVASGASREAGQEAVTAAVLASEHRIGEIRKQGDEEAARSAQVMSERVAASQKQIVTSFSGFLMTMASATANSNAKASMTMFRVAQGLLIAQTTMQAVAAGVRAFADYPWPASAAIAGAATAQALAGVATIASQSPPQFNDTPGAIRAGNAGLTAGFAPGDYVIAAQSPAEVQRQAGELARDSGKSAVDTTAPVVIVTERYKHFGAYWRDQRKTPGQIRTDARRGEASGQRRY